MQLRHLVWATLGVLLCAGCGPTTGSPGTDAGGAGVTDDAGGVTGDAGSAGGGSDGGSVSGDAGSDGGESNVRFTVSVRINGNGAVHSDALSLNCSNACDASVPSGARISFSPLPDQDWTFQGWGDLCSGNGGCEVVVDRGSHALGDFRAGERRQR